jgi:hypothetical protein
VRISCAEGITKWRSRTMASQRRTGGGAHLSEGEENGEGEKYLQPSPPFIGKEREREREGRGGSPKSASHAAVEPDRRAGGLRQVLLSWVANRRARGQYLKVA